MVRILGGCLLLLLLCESKKCLASPRGAARFVALPRPVVVFLSLSLPLKLRSHLDRHDDAKGLALGDGGADLGQLDVHDVAQLLLLVVCFLWGRVEC